VVSSLVRKFLIKTYIYYLKRVMLPWNSIHQESSTPNHLKARYLKKSLGARQEKERNMVY
jgi:hypothetical protein